MKLEFSLSIYQMKKSKDLQYFRCFIVCMLVPHSSDLKGEVNFDYLPQRWGI